jgi:TolA-binding protein
LAGAKRPERRIEGARPTVEKQRADAAQAARAERLQLQIPERLRAALRSKIDQRIARNVAASRALRKEAIVLLRALVEEAPRGSADLPEALMRLGELEWEEARELFLARFRVWEQSPAEGRSEPPNPDYSTARRRFQRVLKEHKSYSDYDLALYVDGVLAQEEGRAEQALHRFNLILAWCPDSRFVPDAHMIRAEYEFTKASPDYATALAEYEKVLSFEGTELHDLALFKSAWTLWRLGRQEEAAKRFLTVFKDTAEADQRSSQRRAEIDELQREALRNLVTVFAEDENNTAEDMHKFLVDAGGEKFAGRIVSALADTFYEQAQYERGIEAYRLLLKLEPTSPTAYRSALRIAQGHSTTENWAALEEDYRGLIGAYAPAAGTKKGAASPSGGSSAWSAAQSEKTRREATAAIEEQLRKDAVGLHAKAQSDKSRSEFEAAKRLYAVYLGRFGQTPAAYEMYFNAGEIDFYHLADAQGAAKNYLAAVRLEPRGALSRDALYNALTALEVARAEEFDAAKAEGRAPQETATDKQLTEAMELYIATYPEDAAVPDLLFRQGKLYYDYSVFDPAVRQWGLLLERYPKSTEAKAAGELILDSFNRSKDYENIEVWARRLKSAPAFSGASEQKKLDVLIVGAVFKQGEQLAEAGEHARAAQAYLRAAREFPGEPRAAQAAVNAEVEAKRAADLATLAAAATLLSEKHGDRDEVPEGLWIAATTYQQIGLFAEAAKYHEQIASRFRKSKHHKDAAFNAVLLHAAVGDEPKAVAAGQSFKKAYPKDALTPEVTFLMGKAYESAQKWSDADKLYDSYAKSAPNPNRRIEAWVRLALVRRDSPKGKAVALDQAIKLHKSYQQKLDDKGRYFAAQARYLSGERWLEEFERVTIEGDVRQLKERLRKKSQLLKKAADEFLEASKMGVAEWTTASLYQIGRTYESFAQALLTAAPPAELKEADAELYRQSIEEFVIPIEERSIEAYESGWLKAVELGIFNEWTAKMRQALGRLSSELYPPLEEVGFEVRSASRFPLPPMVPGPRRGSDGAGDGYLMPSSRRTVAKQAAEPAGAKP